MKEENVTSQEDYEQYVKEMANIFIEEMDESMSDIYYHISLEVDYSDMHRDYENNLKVLRFSDSEPLEWQIYVEDSETDYRKVLQAMAYVTLRQDLTGELQDRIDFEDYQ